MNRSKGLGIAGMIFVSAIVLFLGIKWNWFKPGWPFSSSATTVWSSGPTVEKLEAMGELVSMKINISDVLILEDTEYIGAFLIKGDALISVDLKKARITEIDADLKTARISLPQPRVLLARVDHSRTQTWDVKSKNWIFPGDRGQNVRDTAMKEAQQKIEMVAGSDEYIEPARESATKTIRCFYRLAEWNVEVEFDPIKLK
jgi:hypothetical protein